MTLFTQAQTEQLLANCDAQVERMDNGKPDIDFKPVVKLFTPDAQCTWLLTELGRDDIAFGLCDLGMGTPELGFVSMTELRALRGPLGLPVERDEHFTADRPLSAYASEAREHGRIVTDRDVSGAAFSAAPDLPTIGTMPSSRGGMLMFGPGLKHSSHQRINQGIPS